MIDDRDCVLLGSGSSILDIDDATRGAINANPNTIGLNKFLIFQDLAQIFPKYAFLADNHFPAPKVAAEILRIAARSSESIGVYLHEWYRGLFDHPKNLRARFNRIAAHARLTRRYRYASGYRINYRNLTFFRSNPLANNRPLFWASSLDEELYFHRGSLTTAINLADVIFKPRRIILAGVDLNNPTPFFADDPRLAGYADHTFSKLETKYGLHGTACPHPSAKPVQDSLDDIVQYLRSHGTDVVCLGESSLLVSLGICESLS